MRKHYKSLLIIILFLLMSYNNIYAEEIGDAKRNMWLMLGYSYTLPESQDVNSINGPATLTFGVDIWRFLGIDVTFGYRWGNQLYVAESTDDATYTEAFFSFDIKPYLLLQPKLGIDVLSLRPYFGIGPSFNTVASGTISSSVNSTKTVTSFNVGFSVKAGVRVQLLNYLFLGLGGEYLYHKDAQVYYNKEIYDTDLSGWTVGVEIGSIF